MALRASVPLTQLTRSGWGGNEGFEYWFPRPVDSEADKPLVILGGGREVTLGFQIGQDDDSVLDDNVGKALRGFLPGVFPGKYEEGREPEMEWVSYCLVCVSLQRFLFRIDRHHGVHKITGSICTLFLKSKLV